MSVKLFYNEFVFQTPVENHSELKPALVNAIEARLPATAGTHKPHWFCELNTEFFDLAADTHKYVPLITSAIYPALDRMFLAMPELNRPLQSSVVRIWYNRYEAGHTQEVHTHAKSMGSTPTISGVYFLELNEPNPLVFFSPAGASNPLISEALKADFASEGDIILFPSAMPHYVLPCKTTRTTIAFNINCVFDTPRPT